jgi:hypothetical protein
VICRMMLPADCMGPDLPSDIWSADNMVSGTRIYGRIRINDLFHLDGVDAMIRAFVVEAGNPSVTESMSVSPFSNPPCFSQASTQAQASVVKTSGFLIPLHCPGNLSDGVAFGAHSIPFGSIPSRFNVHIVSHPQLWGSAYGLRVIF